MRSKHQWMTWVQNLVQQFVINSWKLLKINDGPIKIASKMFNTWKIA
jgi:hypothetical protein